MKTSYRVLGAAIAISMYVSSAVQLPAFARSLHTTPSVHVSPHKVKIGGVMHITASHLPSKSYFSLILAVPNLTKRGNLEELLGVVKSNNHGHISRTMRMPGVVRCGAASLYVYALPKPHGPKVRGYRAGITLTGCRATGKPILPPPPPISPTKTKKH